ncbi:MAG TPA: DNA topoisomerase VI, partial [Methanocorpusculum sp.]|nr:DNA topoisomerase VI [Methanocorpusculum sp.]
MSEMNERDIATRKRLMEIAKVWYDQIGGGDVPSITLPTRTKHNIEYDDDSEVWKYGEKESTRNAGTVKSSIQMLKMAYVMDFIKMQLQENRSSTLREMYYISEGWKQAKFHAQNESNYLVEDLEIITNLQREFFHMRPEEDGASIFGPLRVREN